VPDATGWFWLAVVLIAGMGQTASEAAYREFGPLGAAVLGVGGLLTLLTRQLRQGRYVAWAYWPALVAASVFGTMAADAVHVVCGAGYAAVTAAFALVLTVIMAVWYASESTVSGGSVRTLRREALYWASVLTVFALGTSSGDLTAHSLPGGYLLCAALFLVLIAIPAVGGLLLHLQAVAACWAAFVLALAAIGGAWYSQLVWGLQPCELCLLQRWPYYVGVPLAAIATVAAAGASGTRRGLTAFLLWLVCLVFLASLGLGIYHAGVEWGFWAGPGACTGQYVAPGSTDDFLRNFETPLLQAYRPKRVLAAHALLHLFLGCHLEEAV